jgi:hypothetical protein
MVRQTMASAPVIVAFWWKIDQSQGAGPAWPSAVHGVKAPFARDALELVLTTLVESESRACDQVLDRA